MMIWDVAGCDAWAVDKDCSVDMNSDEVAGRATSGLVFTADNGRLVLDGDLTQRDIDCIIMHDNAKVSQW